MISQLSRKERPLLSSFKLLFFFFWSLMGFHHLMPFPNSSCPKPEFFLFYHWKNRFLAKTEERMCASDNGRIRKPLLQLNFFSRPEKNPDPFFRFALVEVETFSAHQDMVLLLRVFASIKVWYLVYLLLLPS